MDVQRFLIEGLWWYFMGKALDYAYEDISYGLLQLFGY